MVEDSKTVYPPILKHATFIGDLEIKAGKGVIATKDIEAGELLLCEKAFVYSHTPSERERVERNEEMRLYVLDLESGERDLGVHAPLLNAAVHKLGCNPEMVGEFMGLLNGREGAMEVDGRVVIDTFVP